ncbi:killer cell lectin-like receptor subfamily G member 1 [Gallus gallus]|uniref:C-type lectin domain containing 5A n=1 Tax=Gallus gallus TaxID=9031 RepID=R4GKZ9_CHICK|nr:killer cell lectin-like receptor subfamily G member 1 [Gallus gallus]XP_046792262.1 killer cell lectin-like receptor subfamily G member 1 [Gallus gallus]|eukprot:XP_003643020.1 killer cell lectin-like receptor subfamily G member 1 [Gallus gallus]
MEEGVMYAELRLPPAPAPMQTVRMPWHWAALSLGALSLLLLLAQIILVGLSFHYLARQGSCCHGPQCMESLSSGLQALQGSCQFCPAGWLWHAGRCYYFSSAKRIWEQGKDDCCSRGAQLVIIRDNSTLAFLTHVSHMDIFHVGLKRSPSRFEWRWLDGTVLKGLFPVQRSTSSFLACGRVSGSGLSGGHCGEEHSWVCEKRAVTLQWLQSSPPTFLWGNTTYTCAGPW